MFPIKALIGFFAGLINVLLTTFCIGRISAGGRPTDWEMYVISLLTVVCVWSFLSTNSSTSKQ
jgi:hypothetical protein